MDLENDLLAIKNYEKNSNKILGIALKNSENGIAPLVLNGSTLVKISLENGEIKIKKEENGATVDLATCTPSGDGAADLRAVWRDPAFKASENAAYYVRVLENPTCRWSTWEANRNGTPPRPDVPATIQERAYTSPIWYIAAN